MAAKTITITLEEYTAMISKIAVLEHQVSQGGAKPKLDHRDRKPVLAAAINKYGENGTFLVSGEEVSRYYGREHQVTQEKTDEGFIIRLVE